MNTNETQSLDRFPLCEKCPNKELFLVRVFEYRKIRNRNNSVFGNFSRSAGDFDLELRLYVSFLSFLELFKELSCQHP